MKGETPLEYLAANGTLPEETPCEPILYWLWLAGVLGPANPHAGRMLDAFDTPREAYEQREGSLFAEIAGRAVVRRMCETEKSPQEYAPVVSFCEARHIRILTFAEAEYPLALSRLPDPPVVLYCTGNAACLNGRKTVGMVGSRRPTAYGAEAAATIGTALAKSGAVIVSGLADGLDSESHRAAVAAGQTTIGVLGVSIEKTYPAANVRLRRQMEQNGAVISEYAPGTEYDYRHTFLQRNRIIAALSDVLLVVEARLKSGTMSTVAHAERYGRTIYAVPGSIFSTLSEGTNALLREGRARIAVDAADILTQLGLDAAQKPQAAPEPPAAPLTDAARKALACIGPKPAGLGELAEQTGLSMGALLGALTALELAGRITALPGRQYVAR